MGIQAEDLSGKRFGRYTVLRRAESYISKDGHKHIRWMCKCDCGSERVVFAQSLRSGKSTSCGCLQREIATKHGGKYTRLYGIWHNIKYRCNNKNSAEYKNYGGRGISVCKEWNDFEPFRDWAITHGYDNNRSIDRIDNGGDYCPENCRWVSAKEQANNRRSNRFITVGNDTHTITEWEQISGLSRQIIHWRLSHGWTPEEALTRPRRGSK